MGQPVLAESYYILKCTSFFPPFFHFMYYGLKVLREFISTI